MNTGLVSSRYASALLKFVTETGGGERVYRQVLAISDKLRALPQLRIIIDNPMSVSDSRKFDLLVSALDGVEMAPELEKFIRLVMKNHRTKLLYLIFLFFIHQYREAHNIKLSRLVTAVPAPDLEKQLTGLVREKTGDSVLFEHIVDPEIIGGFVFEIDGYRLDASVASQLKSVRRQFIERNRRIV